MGTVFNRRLINENNKKDKDLATTVQGLDTRVTALEQGGGGGGSTTLEAVTLAVASHSTSTATTQPSSFSGTGVTIVHDGTRIIGANFSVIGMPLTSGDYSEFYKGLTLTLDTTDLAADALPVGAGFTGIATAEEAMSAQDNGSVVYKIYVGTNLDESLNVTVKIIDVIKADNSSTVNSIVY